MNRLARLLIITFVESFATILVERGVYFYSDKRLGFSNTENLFLALGIGVCYILGAVGSHRAVARLGERRFLLLLMAGHFLCHATLACFPQLAPFLAANLLLALFMGGKWPVIESFISAGRGARETARAVGLFNISWAASVPGAMVAAGQLIAWNAPALFVAAGLINLVVIVMLWPLEARPEHLAHDHPDRPPPEVADRYRVLMVSSRWSMVASYTLLFVLVPLMPTIFTKLGQGVRAAAALSGMVEVARACVFAWMFMHAGWHGKAGALVWSALALPLGFFMVLFSPGMPHWFAGQPLATAVAGEVIFGAAAGMVYYASLYYVMSVSATVESGGAHESLIGSGFALGPMIGILGVGLSGLLGSERAGMLAALGPVAVVCVVAALTPMRGLGRTRRVVPRHPLNRG